MIEHPLNIAPERSEKPTKPSRISSWLHAHPYGSLSLGTFIILALGSFLFISSSGTAREGSTRTWGGARGILSLGSATKQEGQETHETIYSDAGSAPYVPIPIYKGDAVGTSDAYDISALLADLLDTQAKSSAPTNQNNAPASEDPWANFSFKIANDAVHADTTAESNRSPLQRSLYIYGNTSGNLIKKFETEHSSAGTIVRNHIQKRTDPTNAQALTQLAKDMKAFGTMLGALDVPQEVAESHRAYASAYVDMGSRLLSVAESSSDEAFLSAINKYNASVETAARRLVILVGIFSGNSVSFNQSEGGAVFMFNPSLSL